MAFSRVRPAEDSDRNELAKMRVLLWPQSSLEEQLKELDFALADKPSGALPGVILVSADSDGTLLGFLEVGLRSHADGCDPTRPVGFVEGWFVAENLRHEGLGRELMRAAEEWSRAQGCREMASDALVDNQQSLQAHESLGFVVVDRCVHFRKEL
jgi:aminoglycoside 6'-N-acetyltransferase I